MPRGQSGGFGRGRDIGGRRGRGRGKNRGPNFPRKRDIQPHFVSVKNVLQSLSNITKDQRSTAGIQENNDEEKRPLSQIVTIDALKCTGCARCTAVCPKDAITIVNQIAHVDQNRCDGCRLCISECPRDAITLK